MDQPSLEDTRAVLTRAHKHFEEVEREVNRFQDESANFITQEGDEKAPEQLIRIRRPDPPEAIKLPVKDFVGCLRSSLDYLVYALAFLDSGEAQSGTQFPICDTPENFAGELAKGRLRGLSDEHVTAIQREQPYEGGRWLEVIRDMSNLDKHRHLHTLIDFGDLFITGETRAVPSWPHRLGMFTDRWDIPRSTGRQMNVNIELSVHVTFERGTPVVETLQILETGVRKLVDAFEPEFERG